jgi:hypothetical protein
MHPYCYVKEKVIFHLLSHKSFSLVVRTMARAAINDNQFDLRNIKARLLVASLDTVESLNWQTFSRLFIMLLYQRRVGAGPYS